MSLRDRLRKYRERIRRAKQKRPAVTVLLFPWFVIYVRPTPEDLERAKGKEFVPGDWLDLFLRPAVRTEEDRLKVIEADDAECRIERRIAEVEALAPPPATETNNGDTP